VYAYAWPAIREEIHKEYLNWSGREGIMKRMYKSTWIPSAIVILQRNPQKSTIIHNNPQ
jgi:hypothetical protein